MDKLTNIYGIGPELAKKLITKYSLDLNKPIRTQLKKHAADLPVSTQADLKYNPTRRIPNAVIAKLDAVLRTKLRGFKYEISGSYKRGKPFSRDIDIIVSSPTTKTTAEHWDAFVARMPSSVKFMKPYAQGLDKVSTMLKFGKYTCKVDVFFTDPREYMFMSLYATGSGSFNIRMRATAKRLGYLLNQRGLYKRVSETILRRVPIKNEKDLFKKLNMKYLTPSQRIR